MKERPILFSSPMVRALLAGRKTQTRRVVKPKPAEALNFLGGRCDGSISGADDIELRWDACCDDDGKRLDPQWLAFCAEYPEEGCLPIGRAYGQPGDRLWVRETFAHDGAETLYAADCSDAELAEERKLRREFRGIADEFPGGHWRPSIHMPRALSRIMLQITDVRVERLQEISETDAIDEGVLGLGKDWNASAFPDYYEAFAIAAGNHTKPPLGPTPVERYVKLWEQRNGAGSWAANPWVWVIEFERLSQAKEAQP